MNKVLLSILSYILFVGITWAQGGEISGKITDENGDGIPFAGVAIIEDGVPTGQGAVTDFNGFYSIKPLNPGKYDLKFSYLGYASLIQTGVVVKNDQTTYIDQQLKPSEQIIEEVTIVKYKVPLIDPGETSSKNTVTAEDIKDLPTRNIASIAATTAGIYQSDEGEDVNVRGGRGASIVYYVDGIRVSGEANLPVSSIEQIDVITGGVPARYGEATSGVINITTKGPAKRFAGGAEFQSSLDVWRFDLVNVNISGPIIKNKETEKTIMGFALSGEFQREKDPSPSAVDMYKVNDDLFAELQESPLYKDEEGNILVKAENLTFDDLEKNKVKRNTVYNVGRANGRLDFRLSDNMTLAFGGNYSYQRYHSWVEQYSLLNYENNPLFTIHNYRAFGRFTHNIGQKVYTDEDAAKASSAFQNAYYQVQFDVEKYYRKYEDDSHGDDYFAYGHVGQFEVFQDRAYSGTFEDVVFPDGTVKQVYRHLAFTDTAVTFSAANTNPQGAAYTTQFFELVDETPRTVDEVRASPAIINGERAEIRPYGLWYNTGRQYNGTGVDADNLQLRAQINGGFDILKPGSSTRNKHSFQYGYEFEYQINRNYSINPLGLWDLANLNTNRHIQNLDESNPYILRNGEAIPWDDPSVGDIYFSDTVVYDRLVESDQQTFFDQSLRTAIGAEDDEFINIHSLPLETFSIDMFSVEELLNNGAGVVNYRGYDAYGNKISEKTEFADFWHARDENGNFTHPIDAFRPMYMAGYIEDKFQLNDLTFRIGLRVDRYDANQQVLHDPQSLYKPNTVGDVKNMAGFELANSIPENMGDDFAVYVDDVENPKQITAFRDENQWYSAEGQPLASGRSIPTGATGTPTPFFSYDAHPDPAEDGRPVDITDAGVFNPERSFTDYDPVVTVMPRLQFSFNITDNALFFAHYDVLSQRPQYQIPLPQEDVNIFVLNRSIMDPLNYYYWEANNFKTNPALKPETTIDFQLGFKQKITNSSAFSFAAYFKEYRNMVQLRSYEYSYPTPYFTYENIDFGNTKGFEFSYELRRTKNVKIDANYTLQFAEGTGSDDQTQLQVLRNGGENFRTIAPLDWDTRHGMNVVIDYRFATGKEYNGPVSKKGKNILEGLGINIITKARSGTPYTAQSNVTSERIVSGLTRPITEGYINGSRIGWNFKVDAKINKTFTVTVGKDKEGKDARTLDFNVYLWVQNVLGTANVKNVYRYTGVADDDGFIDSPQAQQSINNASNPQSYIDLYEASVNSPTNYTRPRRIYIGGTINF